ncbi:MAG: hypothetical protein P8K73_02845 [Methylophilaceae bacterium]|nr:hypothetical protein [Methylophilaceae bacterium]
MIDGDKVLSDNIDDDEDIFVDYTAVENGLLLIKLPKNVEKNSNIKYEELTKTSFIDSSIFYGESINIKPLINLNTKLSIIQNKLDQLLVNLEAEVDHLSKLVMLNRDNKNISDSVVGQKEIDIKSIESNIDSLKKDKANIMNTIQNEWGSKFYKIFTVKKNNKLKNIISGKAKLIKITFSPNQINQEVPNIINISSIAQTNSNYEALYFSDSPEVDVNRSGKSFYYLVHNSKILNGEKFTGHRLASPKDQRFLFIPKQSVIWSNGIPWAYVHIEDTEKYIKKSLSELKETNNGWIIKEGNLKAGDLIVTEGAQLLLSEEFKYQIKNENED